MSFFPACINTPENLFLARINVAKARVCLNESFLTEQMVEYDNELASIDDQIETRKKEIAIIDDLPRPITASQDIRKTHLQAVIARFESIRRDHIRNTNSVMKPLQDGIDLSVSDLNDIKEKFAINREMASLRTKHHTHAKGVKSLNLDERKAAIAENRNTLPSYLDIGKRARFFHDVLIQENGDHCVFRFRRALKTVDFKVNMQTGTVHLNGIDAPAITTIDPETHEQTSLNAFIHDPQHVIQKL
jgi:hypothetical protein